MARVVTIEMAEAAAQSMEVDSRHTFPAQHRVEQRAALPLDAMTPDERAAQQLPDQVQRLLATQQVQGQQRMCDQRAVRQRLAEREVETGLSAARCQVGGRRQDFGEHAFEITALLCQLGGDDRDA